MWDWLGSEYRAQKARQQRARARDARVARRPPGAEKTRQAPSRDFVFGTFERLRGIVSRAPASANASERASRTTSFPSICVRVHCRVFP